MEATKYKDSGIPWIGMIPSDWEVKRLKNLGYLYGGLTGKSGGDFNVDEDSNSPFMLYIPFTNIFNNSVINTEQLYKVRIEAGEFQNLVQKNDLLFLMSSEDYDGVGKPAIIEKQIDNLSLNSFCKGFRVTESNICAKYLFYHISSHVIRELIRQEAKGFIRINLRQDKLACIPLLLPPPSTQQRIADFLDRKCAEIDELAALQETMIAELKRYKQSVITEAVTKGLAPNVPMQDSGVEWIGEIPEGWEVVKMNHICSVITDFVASGSFESLRVNVPYLDTPDYAMLVRTADLSGSAKSAGKVYISEHSYNFLHNSNLFGGEIILPNIGASVGDVYIVPHLYERMSLAPNAIMFKTKLFDKYYYYYFCSKSGKESIYKISQSTAQAKFNKTELRELRVVAPSLAEQRAIADYLDQKCGEIDELIAIKQQKIEALKEYKKSVIFEYVTGKKEVLSFRF